TSLFGFGRGPFPSWIRAGANSGVFPTRGSPPLEDLGDCRVPIVHRARTRPHHHTHPPPIPAAHRPRLKTRSSATRTRIRLQGAAHGPCPNLHTHALCAHDQGKPILPLAGRHVQAHHLADRHPSATHGRPHPAGGMACRSW